MKEQDLYDALGDVGGDLIDKSAPDKPFAGKQGRAKTRRFFVVAAAAAAVAAAVLIPLAVITAKKPAGPEPAVNTDAGETTRASVSVSPTETPEAPTPTTGEPTPTTGEPTPTTGEPTPTTGEPTPTTGEPTPTHGDRVKTVWMTGALAASGLADDSIHSDGDPMFDKDDPLIYRKNGYPTYHGIQTTYPLYKALHDKNNADAVFCVLTIIGRSTSNAAEEDLAVFRSLGVHAEIRNGMLFLLPTKEEYLNMDLTGEQKEKYAFSLAAKRCYENDVLTAVVPADLPVNAPPYSKLIFNGKKAADALEIAQELQRLFDIDYNNGYDYLVLTLWFPAALDRDPHYQEIVSERKNLKTLEEVHLWREKLNAYSKEYHRNLVIENIRELDFLPATEIVPVEYSPVVQVTVPIRDMSVSLLVELIGKDAVAKVNVGFPMNVISE